jgi:signal transduction histidine kinase
LTATYVFAAVVLVVIVVFAVTMFALSMFGISAREQTDDVARQAPEVVHLEVARTGSLESAAVSIVRELSRPGLHVAVFSERGGHRHMLAASATSEADGRSIIIEGPRYGYGARRWPTVSTPLTEPGPEIGSPLFDASRLDASARERTSQASRPLPNDEGFLRRFMDPRDARNGPGGPGRLALSGEAPPDDQPFAGFNHARPYPPGLNAILHIEPKEVEFVGGRVGIMPDPAPLGRAIDLFWLAMLPTGLFAILSAWLLGRFITLQALRPLVETTESLDRFGAGDFTPRSIMTQERNEIGALVTAYNKAASQVARALEERKAAEDQMRQFIADAGHELRTPLTVIMGFIDVLRRRALVDPGTSTKIFDTMLDESRRMKALIDKLILLARLENHPERELETVDLVEIARGVVASLQTLRPDTPIAFVSSDRSALVRGNENELHDAVANIVENAVKYAPDSQVDVRVRGEGDVAVVEVTDLGPGIPFAEQAQVFDRFYRGRDRAGDAEGFGLGLAIAKRAVERAGGLIDLQSAPGEGSRFSIRIPQASREAGVALAH